MLNSEEIARYQKQIRLNEIGERGQEKLKKARVLVVGAGGLGCPVLQYLTAAGIGQICIVDGDTVELSNLQRQILYTHRHVNQKKAAVAAEVLAALNPYTNLIFYDAFLTVELGLALVPQYDLVVDCTDNFGTRYLLNDLCVLFEKPLVSAAIYKLEGQIGTFNIKLDSGLTCNYRDLYPKKKENDTVLNCEAAGVTGILPGLLGLYQANEVLKYFVAPRFCLINKLLIIDSWRLNHFVINISPRKGSQAFTREDILSEQYCMPCAGGQHFIHINATRLEEMLNIDNNLAVVDVRQEGETPSAPWEGVVQIPLHELPDRIHDLADFSTLIFICHGGKRSEAACRLAHTHFPGKQVYNLQGGVAALQQNNTLHETKTSV